MSDNLFAGERPLPSFAEWLAEHGDGKRAPGAHGWEDLERFMLREIARDPGILTPAEQSFFRLWKGLGIAMVELCRLEAEIHGRTTEEILQAMPRAAGAMAIYTFASVCRDDTPWRLLATVVIEEFRSGAKNAADQLGSGQ